ncbi:MAG: type IV toxin-antitoxin system AbiEi family antitoxin domain-containing protein [Acidimicrobiales bacterium]
MSSLPGNQRRTERDLVALARRQHGVFQRRQALAAGLTPKMAYDRIHAGLWVRVDPSVYALAGAPRRGNRCRARAWQSALGRWLRIGPQAHCGASTGWRRGVWR